MKRRESIGLFREICEGTPEILLSNGMFLMQKQPVINSKKEDFELWIKAGLSSESLESVKAVVSKTRFKIKESQGFSIIYSPESSRSLLKNAHEKSRKILIQQ